MLAREKWQVRTIQVLEMVFKERVDQMRKHGDAMTHLPDGTGPDVPWLDPVVDVALGSGPVPAKEIQEILRADYDGASLVKRLTRMHLVREELAEAFELNGDDPSFIDEILQVAALCVQWAEIKLDEGVARSASAE